MKCYPKNSPSLIDIDLIGADLDVIHPDPRNGVLLRAAGDGQVICLTFRPDHLPILRYLVKCLHQSLNRKLEVSK